MYYFLRDMYFLEIKTLFTDMDRCYGYGIEYKDR